METLAPPDWNIAYSHQQQALIVHAPTDKEAIAYMRDRSSDAAVWAIRFNCQAILVFYPGCSRPIKISAKLSQNAMTQLIYERGFQITGMPITPTLWGVLNEFLEYPERKYALVRSIDNRQVALSHAMCEILGGYSLEQCVTRRREDYWYLPDLDEYLLTARQNLEVNNPQSFLEFNWRGYDPGYTNWDKVTNRYRLIQDENGTLYELSTNLGTEPLTNIPRVEA